MNALSRLRGVTLIAGVLAFGTFTVSSARADAPSKRECIDANAQAQLQQKDGKLRAAQTSLRLCTSPSCPAVVRDDCAQRLDALERVLPSLVFEVKDGSGADLTAVRVSLDGQLLAEKLDGTALAVDPGDHAFTFEVAGRSPVTMKLVIREGDRARRERVLIGPAIAPRPAPVVVVAPTPAVAVEEPKDPPGEPAADLGMPGSAQRTVGVVVAVGGVVGLGVGGLLAGLASSSWSSSQTNCSAPNVCPNHGQALDDHDSAVSKATGATIAFVAGGALLATGLVLYLTAPKQAVSASGVSLVPTIGGATVVGRFW